MPDTGSTEPPDCGNQADDQSNVASVTPQQPRRRRFLPRLRTRRTINNAEQAAASTEQAAKGRKIGLLGIVITALVGFFFGMGSNQVTDYVKRADDCYDALLQYEAGLTSLVTLLGTVQDRKATDDKTNAAIAQINTLIVLPHVKIKNKCPIEGSSEYLNSEDVNRFNASWTSLSDGCLASECSQDNASTYQLAAENLAAKLEGETHVVSQWGLVRRAKYEVTHLY